MDSATSPTCFDELRQSLKLAESVLSQQPESLQSEYHRAGQQVTQALVERASSGAIQLPYRLFQDTPLQVQPAWTLLRAGSLVHRLRRRPCSSAIIQRLATLARSTNPVVAGSAQLTAYLSTQEILDFLPQPDDLRAAKCAAFDKLGQLIAPDEPSADALVRRLSDGLQWLGTVERLFPGWITHDRYNEELEALSSCLIEQGRALAMHYTRQIVSEVQHSWWSGKLTRGLTLYIPYLDENRFRMRQYDVVVIPTGRILFRPEFVVGACRVSQHKVRKDAALSQATRWQLLSQLELIIQAFEAETHAATNPSSSTLL